MALDKITQVSGRAVYVPGDDIDTDRIIPARFMKCVTFDGLGEFLFYDVRLNEDGTPKNHPIDDPKNALATILLSGNNFGCGSSREHAPQAIKRAGFKAVIAEGFAEIFFGNSTQLGMPCVVLTHDDVKHLAAVLENDPSTEVTIDIEALEVRAGSLTLPCQMRDSARDSLISGRWDPIADLLENAPKVDEVAARQPYISAA